jgi:hypothetical protein
MKNMKNMKKNKTRKRGGKYLGEGSFGWILGEPAYPCDKNDINNAETSLENLISKISKKDSPNDISKGEKENFDNEWDGAQYIKNIKNVKNIDNYFILPLKKCKVDVTYARDYPDTYNNLWRAKPIVDKDNKRKYALLPIENKKMLLFDKADNDLDRIFIKSYKNINNFNIFHINNKKIFNIAKGIQILQNNDLIHNDLKTVNCVEHDGKFKMIDLADIRDINTTTDMKHMTDCFTYFIWPSTVAYSHFFTQSGSPIKMTIEILKSNYNENDEFNNNQFKIMMKRYIYDSFTWFTLNDEPEMLKNINEYLNKLIYQKTFGIIENASTMNTDILSKELAKITTFFNIDYYPPKSDYSEDDDNIMTAKVNNYLQEFDKIIEKIGKKGLLKRVDIYSFGIIILNNIMILSDYLKEIYKTKLNISKSPIKYYLYKLYQIVFYCCYQTENNPDIDLIVHYYETIMAIFDMVSNNDVDSPLYILGVKYITSIPDINSITKEQLNEIVNQFANEKTTFFLEEESKNNNAKRKKSIKKTTKLNDEINKYTRITRSKSKRNTRSEIRSRSRSREKSIEVSPITNKMELSSI